MKQRYNGKTLYTKRVKNNILNIYDSSTIEARRDWYGIANDFAKQLSTTYDVPLQKVCGVIAALSPMKNWKENMRIAELFIADGVAKHTKLFSKKAKDIMESSGDVNDIVNILNGNKIISFFLNILNPETSKNITIDRHAISVALGYRVKDKDLKSLTNNQYEFFVNCYSIAAEERGVSGLLMQSATWVTQRKLNEIS